MIAPREGSASSNTPAVQANRGTVHLAAREIHDEPTGSAFAGVRAYADPRVLRAEVVGPVRAAAAAVLRRRVQ